MLEDKNTSYPPSQILKKTTTTSQVEYLVTGYAYWCKLHSVKFHTLYPTCDVINMDLNIKQVDGWPVSFALEMKR